MLNIMSSYGWYWKMLRLSYNYQPVKNKKKCSTAMCFPREPSPPLCTLTSSNHQKCEIKKKSFTLCTRWQLCTYLVGVKSIITLMAPKKKVPWKTFATLFHQGLMVSEQEQWGEIIFEDVFLSLFLFIFSVDMSS